LLAGSKGSVHGQKIFLNDNEILISPAVTLELQYLFEINRITVPASDIISDLSNRIGLEICGKDFNSIIKISMGLSWKRDPFDRIL
jgi:PIN domain nuclease of toxin-antitoxin system